MKKKYLSIIIFAVIGLALLFVYIDDVIKERRSGTLHVVTTTNDMNFYEEDSIRGGINYLIAKSIADSLGLNLEVTVEDRYSRRVRGLRNGRYDVMLTLLPITTESKEDFLFTKPIAIGHFVLVQNRGNDSLYVDDFMDLNGKTLYVGQHTYCEMVLLDLQEEQGLDFDIIELENVDYDKLAEKVYKGEIDFAVMDNHSAELALKKYTNLDAEFSLGFNQFFGWPMEHHKTKLANQMNEFIFTSFSLSHITM